MATVTESFKGVKDGECQVTEFAVGDTVEGDLAAVAVREGWAKRLARKSPAKNKAQTPAKNK